MEQGGYKQDQKVLGTLWEEGARREAAGLPHAYDLSLTPFSAGSTFFVTSSRGASFPAGYWSPGKPVPFFLGTTGDFPGRQGSPGWAQPIKEAINLP